MNLKFNQKLFAANIGDNKVQTQIEGKQRTQSSMRIFSVRILKALSSIRCSCFDACHLLVQACSFYFIVALGKVRPTKHNTSHSMVHTSKLLRLLEKCISILQLKKVQAQMVLTGLISDGFASSRLIAFSAASESRDLGYCTRLLYNIPNLNVFSWNVTIRGYLESGNSNEAVNLYILMLRNGKMRPDNHTYPLLLKVCANFSMNFLGYQTVGHVLKLGFEWDMYVHNALINMMFSCGKLDDAFHLFDEGPVRNLVTWNSMINGCVRRGLVNEALKIYGEMEVQRVEQDEITMIGVVSACAQLANLKLGRKFHRHIEQKGINFTIRLANAVMDMYVKCGDVKAAHRLFDDTKDKTVYSWTTMIMGYARLGNLDVARSLLSDIPEKHVAPWNAIIGGCVQAKRCKDALDLFYELQACNINPDEITMINCLSACSELGALDVGVWIHHYISRKKIFITVALGTALVDMYAKCGDIEKALQVFHNMSQRNSLTWTAIICGLASHGNAHGALSYYSDMTNMGLVPDEITFLGVLSACCHSGLVGEGRKYFAQISTKFNMFPKLKHYSCIIDLLGRAGQLEEAEELIKAMPMQADAGVWGALLFGSRIHGNIRMGEKAASKLLELDPHDSGIYVLLANMYRESNMLEEARNARKMMEERNVQKTQGCSSIEVEGVVNEFFVGNKSHPHYRWIDACLDHLKGQMELSEFTYDRPVD